MTVIQKYQIFQVTENKVLSWSSISTTVPHSNGSSPLSQVTTNLSSIKFIVFKFGSLIRALLLACVGILDLHVSTSFLAFYFCAAYCRSCNLLFLGILDLHTGRASWLFVSGWPVIGATIYSFPIVGVSGWLFVSGWPVVGVAISSFPTACLND